uniref:Uncharacterized protein n=1 Tax=Romanomermis culicivorax TaxID=13658 RepID=A0A915KNA9_ROMCU
MLHFRLVCHSADVNETPNKKRLKNVEKFAADPQSENDRQSIFSTVSIEAQQSEERNSVDNLRSKVKSKKFQSNERSFQNSSSSSEIQSASSNSTGKQTTIAQNKENEEQPDNNNDKQQLNSSEKIISALDNSKEKSTQVIALKTEPSHQRNAGTVEKETTDENKKNPSTPTTNIENEEEAETIKFHILTGIPPEEGELATLKPQNTNDTNSLTATTTRQPEVNGESILHAKTTESNLNVADRSTSANPRSRQRESNEESNLTVGTRKLNPTVDDGSPISSSRSNRPDIDEEGVDSAKTNPTAVDSAEDENPTIDARKASTDISQSSTVENIRPNVTVENRRPSPTEDRIPSVKITSPDETVLISTSRNPTAAEDSAKTTKEDDDSDEESPPQTTTTVTSAAVTSKKSPSSVTAAFNQEKFQNLVHDKFVVLVCNMLAICIFNEADIKNQALLTNISNTFADFIEGDLSLKQQENTFPNTEIEQNIFLDEIIEKTTKHFKKSRHWTGDCQVSKKEISKIAGCEKVFSSTTEETSPSSEATSNSSSDADDETETEINTVGLKLTTTSQVSKFTVSKLPVTAPVAIEKSGDSTSDESSPPATKLETDDQRHLMSFLQSFGFTTAFPAPDEVKTHFITRQPITLPKKSFKQDSTGETDEASIASPTNTLENAVTVRTSVNASTDSIVPLNGPADKLENIVRTTPSVSRRNESQEQLFTTMSHPLVEEIATSTLVVNLAPQTSVVVGSISNQFANDFTTTTTKVTVGQGNFESEDRRVIVSQSSTPAEVSQSGNLSPVESTQSPVSSESSKNLTSSELPQIDGQSPQNSAASEFSRNPTLPSNNETYTDTSITTMLESTRATTMLEKFSIEPDTETPQLTLPHITLTPVPEPKPTMKGAESESTNMEHTAVTVAPNNEVKDLFWNLRLSSLMWNDEYADNTSVKFRELKNRLEPEVSHLAFRFVRSMSVQLYRLDTCSWRFSRKPLFELFKRNV